MKLQSCMSYDQGFGEKVKEGLDSLASSSCIAPFIFS